MPVNLVFTFYVDAKRADMTMEFKQEELIAREIEIAKYLLQGYSLNLVSKRMSIRKKIIAAHVQNMVEKLRAENMNDLIKLLNRMKL